MERGGRLESPGRGIRSKLHSTDGIEWQRKVIKIGLTPPELFSLLHIEAVLNLFLILCQN
jgi:hypothetical protein